MGLGVMAERNSLSQSWVSKKINDRRKNINEHCVFTNVVTHM